MIYSLVGELPRHQYVFVDSNYTHKKYEGFIPAVWFGLVSYPARMWGCTVMFENGAIYRNIPLNALSFSKFENQEWTNKDAQTWDCYGLEFCALEYKYLQGLSCKVNCNKKEYDGEYLFTVAPINDAFSSYPEQAKEFKFIKLNNGRITSQPTNHIIFSEKSFTTQIEFPKNLQRQQNIYRSE
jgi:hypothetical protein